jgi:hypothetical protein
MGNQVWAFDVDGSEFWKTLALGTPFDPRENEHPGQHRSTAIDGWGINIDWGILSTPVIDLDENRMYVVNWMTQETPPGPPQHSFFAHRIDLATMQEIGSPIPIQAALTDEQGKPVLDARGKPVVLHPDQKNGRHFYSYLYDERRRRSLSPPLAVSTQEIPMAGS